MSKQFEVCLTAEVAWDTSVMAETEEDAIAEAKEQLLQDVGAVFSYGKIDVYEVKD